MSPRPRDAAFYLDATFYLMAAGIVAAGTYWRWMAAAHTEFTQDEITSLTAVLPLRHWHEVFWKFNGDNNHYLNSLWLYLAGPDAGVGVRRLPTVVLGILSIAAAGLWARLQGRFAALATMLLFASSYMMVDYGSIARGYSGLILFTLLAMRLTAQALEGRTHASIWLGLAILLGFLCHLYMGLAVLGLIAWCVSAMRARGATWEDALRRTARIFTFPALMVAPLAAWLALSFSRHAFLLGEHIPYHAANVLIAYALALQATCDLPVYVAYLSGLALATLLSVSLLYLVPGDRSRLYFCLLVIVPGLMILVGMQNLSVPRYFLPCCVAYLLMIGDLLRQLWQTGPKARAIAVLLLAMLTWTEMRYVDKLMRFGRGHYAEAIARFGGDGDPTYGVTAKALAKVAQYYATQEGVPARYIPVADWCAAPPRWLLQDSISLSHERPDAHLVYGPDACPQHFTLVEIYPFWGLTGYQWNLFRRDPG